MTAVAAASAPAMSRALPSHDEATQAPALAPALAAVSAAAPVAPRRRRLLRELAAIARLELGEVLRSRWVVFCLVAYAVLAVVFVLVAMRESRMLGLTGTGRVLLSFSHALVLLLPLVGLTATGQAVNRARDDGTLELLFSHPIGRGAYFLAISLVRYLALVLPLLVLLPGIALYGYLAHRLPIPWEYLGRALGVSASLLWVSVAVGLAVSVYVRNQAKALMVLLLVWAAGVALLDFALVGLMLQWQVKAEVVFALAAANPVQAARMALLAAAEPELQTLGPVGFYLANRIGAGALLALGTLGPLVAGCLAWLIALVRFRRGDLM